MSNDSLDLPFGRGGDIFHTVCSDVHHYFTLHMLYMDMITLIIHECVWILSPSQL
jgi:hypothetical protein